MPSDEEILPVPAGFSMVSFSRPPRSYHQRPGGGVAVLIKDHISFEIVNHLSSPDLAVLDLGNTYLIAAYVLPPSSYWRGWTDVDPETKFSEAVTFCSSTHVKPLMVLGDFNARTGRLSARDVHPTRTSADAVMDARGRRLLRLCADNNLVIVNGTEQHAGNFTSHQRMGKSVIDYIIVSSRLYTSLSPHLEIMENDWSDHSILRCGLVISRERLFDFAADAGSEIPRAPPAALRSPETELDRVLANILAQRRTPEELTLDLYGIGYPSPTALAIYVASTARNAGQGNAKATGAVYWGPNNRNNCSFVPEGVQNDNRACLTGILHAIRVTPSTQTMQLYTTSHYAIRSICYWAGQNHAEGWRCLNGDLFRKIVEILRHRVAPVEFRLVKPTDTNQHYHAARGMARTALSSSSAAIGRISDAARPPCGPPLPHNNHTRPKVYTTLAMESAPKAKESVPISAEELDLDEANLDSHRGRIKERQVQAANLKRFIEADSPREWWDLVREWTDAKPKAVRVSADQLRHVFHRRLNPPAHMPEHFDAHVKRIHNLMSASIPNHTVDRTPEEFFTRPFVEDELEWAKAKLAKRDTKTARGIDAVSYKTIASLPNDALASLFNDCISQLDAPQNWFTTVLVGILKKDKPAAD